jgi:hypothetical protein
MIVLSQKYLDSKVNNEENSPIKEVPLQRSPRSFAYDGLIR